MTKYSKKSSENKTGAFYLNDFIELPFTNIPDNSHNNWVSTYPTRFAHWNLEIPLGKWRSVLWGKLYKTHIFQLKDRQTTIRNIIELSKVTDLPFKFDLISQQDSRSKLFPSSLIATYMNIGLITMQYEHNMGLARTIIHNTPTEKLDNQYIAQVSPLSISEINQNHLQISLHTDIWFPWVVGFMTDKPVQSKEEMYDNRQLAWRHTPRLNQCLTEIKELVVKAGGTWEVGTENVHEEYQHMVMDTGIELGMPDDVKYLKNNE